MRFRLFVLVAAVCSGCFYDSRWGEEKKLQQARAAQTRPTLSAEPAVGAAQTSSTEPPSRGPHRTLRVRALLTRSFTTGVVDAPRHVRTVLGDASDVLEPTLGARLELESLRTWDLAQESDLQAVLAESKKTEPGTDVDWVVGFVGALPRVTQSFHDLGMGEMVGKHVVVRAPSSAERHDAVESSYNELSDDERRAIQKGIKRHRAAVVLLHEIGHTLGLVHERSARSIMFREYSPRASSFGPEAAAVMKVALDGRGAHTAPETSRFFRELAVTLKRAPEGVFVEDERRQMAARYDEVATKNDTQQAQVSRAPAPPPVPETPELTPEHRAIFVKAHASASAGENLPAWEAMKPLFAAYPSSVPVQDLRCQLAMKLLSFAAARPECDRIMMLSK